MLSSSSFSSPRAKILACILFTIMSICNDSLVFVGQGAPALENSQVLYTPALPMRVGEFDFGEISPKLRRRVSGFVPMRGKKDNTIPSLLNYMEQEPPRELDQDAKLSRLTNAMESQQHQQQLANGQLESVGLANSNWQPVVAVPRQFFYQMTNHHQEPADQSNNAGNNNNWQAGSAGMPSSIGWGLPATNSMLMEAKLRRAFHPMRGKRVNLDNLLASDDQI